MNNENQNRNGNCDQNKNRCDSNTAGSRQKKQGGKKGENKTENN